MKRVEEKRRKKIKEDQRRSNNIKEEKVRRKKTKEEKVRRKKIRVREKVGTQNTVFFPWVAPDGRKVGLLKRRVRSHAAREEMNNCMHYTTLY